MLGRVMGGLEKKKKSQTHKRYGHTSCPFKIINHERVVV